MCLWLITACLGMLPTNPTNNIVVQVSGIPQSILTPTAAPTGSPTGSQPPGTSPTGTPPSGIPPTGTPPAGTPPAGTPPAGTPPAGTPPSGSPPTGSPPTGAPTMSSLAPTASLSTTTPTTAPPAASTYAPQATPTVAPVTASTVTGEYLLPVLLCPEPNFICVANPDDGTGTIAIDPRLGSTLAPSAAYQFPPINGYTAPFQPLDSAIKFPREKRSAPTEAPLNEPRQTIDVSKINATLSKLLEKIGKGHAIRKRQTNCRCVAAGTCVLNTNYGAGLLDVRIVTPGAGSTQCPFGQEYCCGATTGGGSTTIACGTLQNVPAVSVTPTAGQANYGEFPWQAMVLTKQNDYLAGGVLIDQLNVLTVTHRIVNYVVSGTAPNMKVRLGEWDAGATYEPVPYQEYNVARVFTHPSYNPTTLQYDITVLRLASSVPLSPAVGVATTINRACLPPSSNSVYTGQRCMVSGWGKNMFGLAGQYQQILKKVDVPIVAPATCQSSMQSARLGTSFVLDTTSFVCAGGEANKDSCTGDGGSGLVCNFSGSWTVVGLVSWGLGCAATNVPAAYVNVAALLPWIQQQVATA